MQIGDIYKFRDNRIRIVMFDNNEVFYLTIKEDNTFVYSKNRTLIYLRTPKDFFEKNSEFIEHLKLTEKEVEKHKPNLPLRLNCFSGLFWTNKSFENETEFNDFIKFSEINEQELKGLDTSKVVIFPTSQQQSNKKSTLLENKYGRISGKELMIECFGIQSEYVKPDKPYFSRFRLIPDGREEKRLSGIGIYRLGIKGNLPSYYLGGEMSMMELESEKSLIVEK
ncbi:hypothetical protein [Winogradskyella endarachnes]|uniref:Uncharacterized protein n=1 Tax=Winogradskyella endarachnes TaxID=2681965 RepID=A0A6L6U7Z9_9FLAO|nr:hypothetical protein [Winogradskyella endarachnes]MUU78460.1 hypothetical protein [Winogradskyella endarachnes]